MLDHVHLLVSLSEDADIKKLIRNWKHWTAQNFGFRWQRVFFEHRLRSDERLDEKAGYILENPVRAGLVAKSKDWPPYRFVSGVTA
jgi:REP element-mobilizing transposase RayT